MTRDTPYSQVVAARIVETADATETEALGAELAASLRAGDVVLVLGELGSGKTTLVRGAVRALGVSDPVTSPTFSVGHRYRVANTTVSHLDLYRLESLEREDPELLDDYVGSGRIAFVEWPEIAGSELGDVRLRVTLKHAGADRRRIEIVEPAGPADEAASTGPGSRAARKSLPGSGGGGGGGGGGGPAG
jgi:tRNA threonylcarbamoyladenosine biosynthesis protein TsaE